MGFWVEQTQELLQKWEARARSLRPRMEIFREGLMLGAVTVLAGMARDDRGRPRPRPPTRGAPWRWSRRLLTGQSSLISWQNFAGRRNYGTTAVKRSPIFI